LIRLGLSGWLTAVVPDELEPIEAEFRAVAAGLPYERGSGELSALGPVGRGIAARIADAIRGYPMDGVSSFMALAGLAELLDAAEAETTINRLEQTWQS
jgi:hypothetical protein